MAGGTAGRNLVLCEAGRFVATHFVSQTEKTYTGFPAATHATYQVLLSDCSEKYGWRSINSSPAPIARECEILRSALKYAQRQPHHLPQLAWQAAIVAPRTKLKAYRQQSEQGDLPAKVVAAWLAEASEGLTHAGACEHSFNATLAALNAPPFRQP